MEIEFQHIDILKTCNQSFLKDLMNIMNQKLAVFRNDVVNDLLACRICFEPFTTPNGNRAPRFLPQCGHTFCSKCVITLFGARDFRGFSKVPCPTCQAEKDVFLEHGAGGFVLNRHVLDFLEASQKSRPSAEEISPSLGCSIEDAGEAEAEASFLSGRAATKRTDRNCAPERIRQSEIPGKSHSDCKAGDGDASED